QCKNGEEPDVETINEVTNQINQLAQRHHLPPRKMVTVEMVRELCK
ncbi:DUF2533 family protein, partial [Acinetobacter baumannii]